MIYDSSPRILRCPMPAVPCQLPVERWFGDRCASLNLTCTGQGTHCIQSCLLGNLPIYDVCRSGKEGKEGRADPAGACESIPQGKDPSHLLQVRNRELSGLPWYGTLLEVETRVVLQYLLLRSST